MGQKTSPISTRLYGNCWPESCWYSDANTFSLFYQEFNFKQFFYSVMPPTGRQFGFRPASIVGHQFPKKNLIHLFFLRRNRRLKLRGNKRRRVAKLLTRFQSKGLRMPINKRLSVIDVVAIYHLYMNKNMLLTKLLPFANYAKRLSAATTLGLRSNTSKRPYNTHMSELFRFTSGSNAFIVPLRLNSIMVSASLIATHISSLLQQKRRFQSICKWLFKDIKKYEAIKGVRISCSGRLNGKAIARTDLRKLGETSLHTFKKKIDYAQSMAITRHGVLGIKVWLSYSQSGGHKKVKV